jgi:cytochrome c553
MRRTILWTTTLRFLAAAAAILGMNAEFAVSADPPQPVRAKQAEQLDFFERKIRPALVEHCYACHSREAAADGKLKGGLKLDTAAGWRTGGDSGPAIVPGKPEESLLVEALRYESYEMPPKGKLPDAVIADFARWIDAGAADPRTGDADVKPAKRPIDIETGRRHWAYQLPTAAPLPDVKQPQNAANRIDRRILARLDAAGLAPAPPADRVTLARRLYFDLIGLPPTPEDVDAFVADASPDAYERLVDRLLSSPRYGERWGRHWLDVARFAESLTLRGFILNDAWRYRDYVVEAFNHDRPYDAFVREQVAGDLLAAANESDATDAASIAHRRRQITATSFLAIGNTNLEEQDKKQLDMDVVDEQLDVLGKAFLAQTIACARCHDHKFDPIPTRDYYALAGILRGAKALEHANVSQWLTVPLPLPADEQRRLDEHTAALAALEKQLAQAKQRLARLTAAGASTAGIVAIDKLTGIVVDDLQAKRVGQWQVSTHTKAYIGDGYLHDQDAGKGEKTLTFAPDFPKPGKYEVRIAFVAGGNRAASVPVTVFSADGEKTIHVNQQASPPLDGHFVSLGQYDFEKTDQSFVLLANEGTTGHVIADAVQFIPVDQLADEAGKAAGDSAVRSPADDDLRQANAAAAADAAAVARMEAEVKKLKSTGPQPQVAISLVDEHRGVDLPVHIRGSVHSLGEVVPRGFLQVASYGESPRLPGDQSGRLQLAQWLADRHNPLTARVMANRVWHWLFGAGLVRTVDNFGTTGEPPSHPQLLDELALELVDSGWSIKGLIRRIVTSRTYRAESVTAEAHVRGDPENRLLAHANRRRLDAECLRDAILAASGQLRLDSAGPTFPDTLSADYGYRHRGFERSVYVPAFRNAVADVLSAFDAANASLVTGRRDSSTVAPQALLMLNHPFVHDNATAAAERLLLASAALTSGQRIERAYRLALGRQPTAEEAAVLLRFVDQTVANDKNTIGDAKSVAAWRAVFLSLFASVDFRFVD